MSWCHECGCESYPCEDRRDTAAACLALAGLGFAFQRIADRAAAHEGANKYHPFTWNDIDEALGLADQEYVTLGIKP